MFKATLTAALLTATPLWADNCDVANLSGFDAVYCFSKVYIGEDNRLNENYQGLRKHLNAYQRQTLLDAQRGWIAKRNSLCMVNAHTVNVDCALRETRERADFLSARTIECKTVGCAASKLTQF